MPLPNLCLVIFMEKVFLTYIVTVITVFVGTVQISVLSFNRDGIHVCLFFGFYLFRLAMCVLVLSIHITFILYFASLHKESAGFFM